MEGQISLQNISTVFFHSESQHEHIKFLVFIFVTRVQKLLLVNSIPSRGYHLDVGVMPFKGVS